MTINMSHFHEIAEVEEVGVDLGERKAKIEELGILVKAALAAPVQETGLEDENMTR